MDDIYGIIILLLNRKDFRNSITVNKRWYTSASWKLKVERDYAHMSIFLTGTSPKERYLLFSSYIPEDDVDGEDLAPTLFEHVRDERKMLYSKISIKDLLCSNKEALLLACIIGIDKYSLETCRWGFKSIKIIQKEHGGDCVKMSCTCYTCFYENRFSEGVQVINRWRDVYSDISIFDVACIIVSVKPLYEARHTARKNAARSSDRLNLYFDYDTYPFFDMKIPEQMDHWLSLTLDKQQEIISEVTTEIRKVIPS
jgi:hypothetical protein